MTNWSRNLPVLPALVASYQRSLLYYWSHWLQDLIRPRLALSRLKSRRSPRLPTCQCGAAAGIAPRSLSRPQRALHRGPSASDRLCLLCVPTPSVSYNWSIELVSRAFSSDHAELASREPGTPLPRGHRLRPLQARHVLDSLIRGVIPAPQTPAATLFGRCGLYRRWLVLLNCESAHDAEWNARKVLEPAVCANVEAFLRLSAYHTEVRQAASLHQVIDIICLVPECCIESVLHSRSSKQPQESLVARLQSSRSERTGTYDSSRVRRSVSYWRSNRTFMHQNGAQIEIITTVTAATSQWNLFRQWHVGSSNLVPRVLTSITT